MLGLFPRNPSQTGTASPLPTTSQPDTNPHGEAQLDGFEEALQRCERCDRAVRLSHSVLVRAL